MSFRHHHAAAAALLFVSLSGMSLAVPAADTKPLVPQNCAQPVHVAKRAVSGHPGKSIQFPRRVVRSAGNCHAGKSEPLVLVGFTDARGGVSLERGNLERVIERVNARRFGRLSAAELTNLCVAQTATKRLELARNSCNEAVARSVADRDGLDRRFGASRVAAAQSAAVAYSNRAVMHWLLGDAIAAHNDLDEAVSLAPAALYVTRNLQVTGPSTSLAGVRAVK